MAHFKVLAALLSVINDKLEAGRRRQLLEVGSRLTIRLLALPMLKQRGEDFPRR